MISETGVAIVAFLLLIIVLPLGLSADSYFRAQKLAQPTVRFVHKWWRNFSFWWTLLQTSFGMALLAGACTATVSLGADPLTFVVDIVLLLVAWRCFPAICLYWTYWQWDGRAHLSFNRAEKMMTYVNREISLTFAVSEIERLSRYAPAPTRAASADYNYTILHLSGARELFVTSLICDIIDWLTILPAVKTEVISQRFAWLPTDLKFRKFFSPFSN